MSGKSMNMWDHHHITTYSPRSRLRLATPGHHGGNPFGGWGSTEKILMDLDGSWWQLYDKAIGQGKENLPNQERSESAFLDLGWYWCVTPRPQGMWHCGTVHPDHGHKQNIQVPTRSVCSKPCGLWKNRKPLEFWTSQDAMPWLREKLVQKRKIDSSTMGMGQTPLVPSSSHQNRSSGCSFPSHSRYFIDDFIVFSSNLMNPIQPYPAKSQ